MHEGDLISNNLRQTLFKTFFSLKNSAKVTPSTDLHLPFLKESNPDPTRLMGLEQTSKKFVYSTWDNKRAQRSA